MSAASYRSSSYDVRASRGGRAASWALALGIAAAIILALLGMGGYDRQEPGDGRRLATFNVTPLGSSETSKRSVQRARAAAAPAATPQPRTVTEPREAPVVPPPPVTLHLPGVIMLSRSDYAASNIGKIKGTAGQGDGTQTASAGEAGGDPSIGTGPGGEPMYAAEWYRKPTRTEMATYLPAGKLGWGVVACRTIARYHVEDCRELGETPGSRIAGAVRQAAWQFLIRPPRKGGQAMLGVWVRIRYDILPEGSKELDSD
ncbi:hypothetical protein [Sphingomonas sp.]|uniref:hypothetical protein n=1 Tax=Sphingomonas sp. TaxID=28214 RepID=UPI0035C78E2C